MLDLQRETAEERSELGRKSRERTGPLRSVVRQTHGVTPKAELVQHLRRGSP